MGQITTYQNTPVTIDLRYDVIDNGWSIVDGKAVHHGCNQGLVKNLGIPTVAGKEYTITYVVSNYTYGMVKIIVGGVEGAEVTQGGEVKEVITAVDNSGVYFYSDGNLTVDVLKVADGVVDGITFSYNGEAKSWITYHSFMPEFMNKFLDKFITFKDGKGWIHHTNETRNNFYGEQYTSKITFYCNLNPTEVKNFYTIREKSNKVWAVTEATIDSTEGKSDGMQTRIKKGNFDNLNGDWFAAFLKNLKDPRFTTELDALMNGADMQGNVMSITIENTDTVEVRLLSVDVEVSPQQYTY